MKILAKSQNDWLYESVSYRYPKRSILMQRYKCYPTLGISSRIVFLFDVGLYTEVLRKDKLTARVVETNGSTCTVIYVSLFNKAT